MKAIKHPIIAVCIILAFIQTVSAQQFWDWSEPVALTDSISDNINPYLFYNGTSFYMVWEKTVDSTTTAIWFRNITDQTPDIELVSTPGVHYKNPKILGLWGSPDFYLFYETNEAGNDDIYYMYNEGLGSFATPVPFANSDFDENSFSPDHLVHYGRDNLGMVWIKDSSVYYAVLNNNQFSDPEMVDSGNCQNPVITNQGYDIVWEKGDTSFTYLAFSNSWSGSWIEPDTAFFADYCTNLKTDKIDRSMITFSFLRDTVWKIGLGGRNGYHYDIDTVDVTKSTPFNPAITPFWIPVDNSDYWMESFLAFPYPDSNSVEIFMNQDPWGGGPYSNFSQLGSINQNPDFFCSPYPDYYCEGIYLVWESYQNEHWQLFYSLAMQQCYGSVNENDLKNSFIKTLPNPFTNQTTLEFTLEDKSNVSIDIYNSQGRHINTLASQSYDPGTHQLRWNTDRLSAGMYIIKIIVGDMTYSSKVIKNR